MSWDMFVFLMFILVAMAGLSVFFAFMKWRISPDKERLRATSRQLLDAPSGKLVELEAKSLTVNEEPPKSEQESDLVRLNSTWLEMKGTFTLPTSLLFRLAQQERITRARDVNLDRVEVLTGRIKREGVTRPAVLTVSRDGKLVLQDGHHLLVAAESQGLTHLPCKVLVSDNGIKIPSQLVSEVLEELLLTANTHPKEP